MGQQQLLIIILVTTVIGIAMIVALSVFENQSKQANRDAVYQDLLSSASFSQTAWEKPKSLGGAGNDFTNLNSDEILKLLHVPKSDFQAGNNEASNENGTYKVLEPESSNQIIIVGEPKSGPPNLQITISRDPDNGQWIFEFSDF